MVLLWLTLHKLLMRTALQASQFNGKAQRDGRSWSVMENIQGISLDLGQYLVGSQIRARLSVVDNFGTETILVSQPSRTIEKC